MNVLRRLVPVCWLLLASCAGPTDFRTLSTHGFIGREVEEVTPLPTTALVDEAGQSYRLGDHNADKVVLLFFGYMNCPDICPVHLANLGAVLQRLPDAIARQVQVVFVTTDPARDSLSLLGPWVRAFNPGFIALSGSDSAVAAAEREAGLTPAVRTAVDDTGNYAVVHAAQLVAYSRDGLRRLEYPFGTRQSDWAHDLPLLVAFEAAR